VSTTLKPPGIGTTVQGGGKRRSVIATGYKEGAPTELIRASLTRGMIVVIYFATMMGWSSPETALQRRPPYRQCASP